MPLFFSKTSLKSLAKRERGVREKILAAAEGLPDAGDVRKIKGQSITNLYRLRVGKYRVLFVREKDIIKIVEIDTRGDIYK